MLDQGWLTGGSKWRRWSRASNPRWSGRRSCFYEGINWKLWKYGYGRGHVEFGSKSNRGTSEWRWCRIIRSGRTSLGIASYGSNMREPNSKKREEDGTTQNRIFFLEKIILCASCISIKCAPSYSCSFKIIYHGFGPFFTPKKTGVPEKWTGYR